jgi:hypothetical protein
VGNTDNKSMSFHDLIGESRNIPFSMNSSAYKHIERMLFPENLDYPVTPDNDRKERNHVSSFSLLQRTVLFISGTF